MMFILIFIPSSFAEDNALEDIVLIHPAEGPKFNYTMNVASLDENFTINAVSNETNDAQITLPVVTVNASNLTKTFGDNETFHGYVNETNTSITIHILLTRLNTGASKFYDVNTDTNGYFELPINLAPGTYKADILKLVVYGGLSIFDSYDIFVLDSSLNDTQTFLSYGANLFRNGFKGNNLTGVLKTQDNKFLSNQVIEVEITPNSNGASKTYFITTNANGVYSLPINLAEEGSYTFRYYCPNLGQKSRPFFGAFVRAQKSRFFWYRP